MALDISNVIYVSGVAFSSKKFYLSMCRSAAPNAGQFAPKDHWPRDASPQDDSCCVRHETSQRERSFRANGLCKTSIGAIHPVTVAPSRKKFGWMTWELQFLSYLLKSCNLHAQKIVLILD